MMSKKEKFVFEVKLIGDTDVGKSTTLARFKEGIFIDNITSTIIGLDVHTKDVTFSRDGAEQSVQVTKT